MSTLKVSSVQHPSAASAAIALDANGQATLNGLAFPTSGSLSGRNRIINGDMRIDQRNAGASVTLTNAGNYVTDRWQGWEDTDGTATLQQSSVAPATFSNSLLFTVTSADTSLGATQYAIINQKIEGYNVADLAFGTSDAKTITLSFWVRSSVTGTFGGGLLNLAQNRSYPFTYAINAANTWEQKVVTISGDTTGTWLKDNGMGLQVSWGLGVGSSYSATAGSWVAGVGLSATGATNLMATNGATWQITGVQLEAGSVATPFERRSYGQELALCQRYYEKTYDVNVAPGATTVTGLYLPSCSDAANNAIFVFKFAVPKRAASTNTAYNQGTGASGTWTYSRSGGSGTIGVTFHQSNTDHVAGYLNIGAAWVVTHINGHLTSDSEL